MTEVTNSDAGWLSREDMDLARERLPILYVDVVPVRVDGQGTVIAVGLLLRAGEDGQIKRALVSGRVLYHERVRAALLRHVEKDLGPLALPRVPPAPQPFTVAEYFPTPASRPSTTRASTRCRWRTWCRSRATAPRSRMPSSSPGSRRRRRGTRACSPS